MKYSCSKPNLNFNSINPRINRSSYPKIIGELKSARSDLILIRNTATVSKNVYKEFVVSTRSDFEVSYEVLDPLSSLWKRTMPSNKLPRTFRRTADVFSEKPKTRDVDIHNFYQLLPWLRWSYEKFPKAIEPKNMASNRNGATRKKRRRLVFTSAIFHWQYAKFNDSNT